MKKGVECESYVLGAFSSLFRVWDSLISYGYNCHISISSDIGYWYYTVEVKFEENETGILTVYMYIFDDDLFCDRVM